MIGAGAERLVDAVGEAAGDVEEALAAGSAVMGDGGLEKVAGAVEFVVASKTGPAALRLDGLEIAVDVAVGRLGFFQDFDGFVEIGRDPGIVGVPKLQGRRLKPLVQVRIHEHRTVVLGLFLKPSVGHVPGHLQVLQVHGLHQHLPHVR